MAAIALVVGNAASPSSGDAAIKTLLEGAGHTVTYVSDESAVSGGQALHFITESGSPTQLGTKYQNLSTPVISFEVGGWDDQLWTNTNGTNQGSGTTLKPLASPHAITAGLADPFTVYTASGGRYGATIASAFGAGVEGVCLHATVTTAYCAFAYDVGDTLVGGIIANARQVGMGIIDAAAAILATDGNTLVLNAVTWALAGGAKGLIHRHNPARGLVLR